MMGAGSLNPAAALGQGPASLSVLPTSIKGKGKGAVSIYGDRSVMQSLTSQRKKPLSAGKQTKGKRAQPGQGPSKANAMQA